MNMDKTLAITRKTVSLTTRETLFKTKSNPRVSRSNIYREVAHKRDVLAESLGRSIGACTGVFTPSNHEIIEGTVATRLATVVQRKTVLEHHQNRDKKTSHIDHSNPLFDLKTNFPSQISIKKRHPEKSSFFGTMSINFQRTRQKRFEGRLSKKLFSLKKYVYRGENRDHKVLEREREKTRGIPEKTPPCLCVSALFLRSGEHFFPHCAVCHLTRAIGATGLFNRVQ